MAGTNWVHVKTLNVNDLWCPLSYSHLPEFVLKINRYLVILSALKNLTMINNGLY